MNTKEMLKRLSLPPEKFTRRAPRPDLKTFTPARDETAALYGL